MSSLPLQFLLLAIAGWMTRDHQSVTEYLLAENAVPANQLARCRRGAHFHDSRAVQWLPERAARPE
jgi:hypothetical protein